MYVYNSVDYTCLLLINLIITLTIGLFFFKCYNDEIFVERLIDLLVIICGIGLAIIITLIILIIINICSINILEFMYSNAYLLNNIWPYGNEL